MKNLKNYQVEELKTNEQREFNGGVWWRGAAILAKLLAGMHEMSCGGANCSWGLNSNQTRNYRRYRGM